MDFRLTKLQLGWQEEVRAFLRNECSPELKAELRQTGYNEVGPLLAAFHKKMRAKNWFGINWPKEYGGLEKNVIEQYIFLEEFRGAGIPVSMVGATIIGPTIIRVGTDENKRMWLGPITSGEAEWCLGYSEPDAGTDLASLSTRAELVGDQWVINGVKTWISEAHNATHMWTAVRTDPAAAKHKGISVIAVSMKAPGVTTRPIWTWGDRRVNEVLLEDVYVPRNFLIGEVNKGWNYITGALDFERMLMGNISDMRQLFDDLVQLCNRMLLDGEVLAKRPAVRMKIAELAMELEVARLFGWRAASLLDAGQVLSAEASMMKVYVTELRAKVSDWGTQVLDLYGQLNTDDPMAPLFGELTFRCRYTPFLRFGGGTNEVQRDIIAQRGLGLPRPKERRE